MPTYNRVVYHEAKHETDVTAEGTKIKLSTAALHTCRYVVSTAQDKPNQKSKHSNQLMTSNAQFAFKKCHSTSMCTALVKEVVSYYNGRNTNVYACLLDATKEFDCVRYDKLF